MIKQGRWKAYNCFNTEQVKLILPVIVLEWTKGVYRGKSVKLTTFGVQQRKQLNMDRKWIDNREIMQCIFKLILTPTQRSYFYLGKTIQYIHIHIISAWDKHR